MDALLCPGGLLSPFKLITWDCTCSCPESLQEGSYRQHKHTLYTIHTVLLCYCDTVLLCYCVTQAPTAVHLAVLVPVPVPVDKTYTLYTGPNGSAPVPGSGPLQARTP